MYFFFWGGDLNKHVFLKVKFPCVLSICSLELKVKDPLTAHNW